MAERAVIDNAWAQLTRQCAAGFGFDWTSPEQTAQSEQKSSSDSYVISSTDIPATDLADAQQYGYHLPPNDPNSTLNPNQKDNPKNNPAALSSAAVNQPSASERLVLYGTDSTDAAATTTPSATSYQGKSIPAGGCTGQANRTLWPPDGQGPDDVANQVDGAAQIQAWDDSRVAAAITKWQSCMATAGYNIKRDGKEQAPFVAVNLGTSTSSATTVTQAEIAQAVTDVKCKQSSKLTDTWVSVFVAYENAGIQQNIQQLKAERDTWDAAATKAAGILGVPVPQ